jgi:putative ABC transport system permease protein
MTTLTRPELTGAGAPPPADLPPGTSRYGTWRGSWAVALRMARREVRRHRGRSLISLLMVGVPTALLAFALTIYPTAEVTGAERIPYELGNAAASFSYPAESRVAQDPANRNSGGGDPSDPAWKVTPLPGWNGEGTPAELASVLGRQFGGTVVPLTSSSVRLGAGDRSRRADLVTTTDPAAFGSALRLTSGRWATDDAEVVVSRAAVDSGLLPASGSMTLDSGDGRTVTIVGVAEARTPWGAPLEGVIGRSDFGARTDSYMTQYYLFRGAPFTWSQVRQANAFGLSVLSAEVLRNPPAASELDPHVADMMSNDRASQVALVVAGGAILLIVVTLLVGPAFAVGAARQRRTLALAASNGATTTQLRRTVLSQAVVLGALAAVLGAVLGVLAVPVTTRVIIPIWEPWSGGPLDLPWLQVAGVMAVGMVSALVAAVVPAQRLGRLDIVGVMKGQSVSPPPSKVLFALGLLGAAAGGAVLFYGIVTRASEIVVVAGAVALIVGSLLLVPVLLTLVARLARHFPVALRMATRDAARQRARSAPSVAAVVGAVAALTMIGVGLSSDTEQQRRAYVPQTIAGEALVYFDGTDPKAVEHTTETIARTVPGLAVVPVARLGSQMYMGPGTEDDPMPFVNSRPAGCTTQQTVSGDPNDAPPPGKEEGWTPRCTVLGSNASASYGGMGALPLEEMERRFHLSDEERSVVAGGGAIAFTRAKVPGTITVVDGTYRMNNQTGQVTDIVEKGTHDLRVVVRALDRATGPLLPDQLGLFVTTQTAERTGWPMTTQSLVVHAADGAIGTEAEERLNAALDRDAFLSVERGFQRYDILVMGIIVGVFSFLILVITLTSTALSMAEQQRDDATLAAVGATRRTRRSMAAAQATVISLLGALIGLAVGLVPGVAITYPLTGTQQCDEFTNVCTGTFVDPVIEIPWLWLGVVAAAVPLVAALVAAVSVRREPVMTRRAT